MAWQGSDGWPPRSHPLFPKVGSRSRSPGRAWSCDRSRPSMRLGRAGRMFHTHYRLLREGSQPFTSIRLKKKKKKKKKKKRRSFGLTTGELFAWVHSGGGQALCDELSAGFRPSSRCCCCSPGAQMGRLVYPLGDEKGGFSRPALSHGGPWAPRSIGGSTHGRPLPAAEIVPSLRSGAIRSHAKWVGHGWTWDRPAEAASHYYHPGWHEPGAAFDARHQDPTCGKAFLGRPRPFRNRMRQPSSRCRWRSSAAITRLPWSACGAKAS